MANSHEFAVMMSIVAVATVFAVIGIAPVVIGSAMASSAATISNSGQGYFLPVKWMVCDRIGHSDRWHCY